MNKLLVICGPTGSGKTATAVNIAKSCNGELVSADSRQVYTYMDIGTGKDLPATGRVNVARLDVVFKKKTYTLPAYDIGGVPIWMYDVVKPDEGFSVSHYYHLAAGVITSIWKRHKLPIIVGGTGFYIDVLLHPPESLGVPPDASLRKELNVLPPKELQERLRTINIELFEGMNQSDRNNPRRLVRKIEIAMQGRTAPATNMLPPFEALVIGLTLPVPVLFENIDKRVDRRVTSGVIEEIRHLLSLGYTWDLPALNTLGYMEWKSYVELPADSSCLQTAGQIKQSVIDQWKLDEHKYAKRQLTWFKKRKNIHWFDATREGSTREMTREVLSWYTGPDEHKN